MGFFIFIFIFAEAVPQDHHLTLLMSCQIYLISFECDESYSTIAICVQGVLKNLTTLS